jgi:hypothetical protein
VCRIGEIVDLQGKALPTTFIRQVDGSVVDVQESYARVRELLEGGSGRRMSVYNDRISSLQVQADKLRSLSNQIGEQIAAGPTGPEVVMAVAQLEVAAALNEIAAAMLAK